MKVSGSTILIVEDEPIIGFMLEDLLQSEGAQTILASELEQVDPIIASTRIDAAILDINVHGKSSYPVAEKLVALGIPFMFATGYGNALHSGEFANVPTIAKPYSIMDIERTLQQFG